MTADSVQSHHSTGNSTSKAVPDSAEGTGVRAAARVSACESQAENAGSSASMLTVTARNCPPAPYERCATPVAAPFNSGRSTARSACARPTRNPRKAPASSPSLVAATGAALAGADDSGAGRSVADGNARPTSPPPARGRARACGRAGTAFRGTLNTVAPCPFWLSDATWTSRSGADGRRSSVGGASLAASGERTRCASRNGVDATLMTTQPWTASDSRRDFRNLLSERKES